MAQTPKIPPRSNAGGLMTASVLQGSFQSDIAALSHRAQPIQMYGGGRRAWQLPPSLMLARSGGEPMAADVRQKMEGLFRTDFSSVRIHSSPQAQAMGALALTMGDTLHFAPGRYNPKTPQGMQILGHELAHVVQQRAGRVKAQGSGMVVLHDPALEAEADRFGRRAVAPLSNNATAKSGNSQTKRAPLIHANTRTNSRPIQPWLLSLDKSQAEDHTYWLRQISKKEVTGVFEKTKSFLANAEESLTLLAHADQTDFGGYDPQSLVNEFMQRDFATSTHKKIELLGCGVTESVNSIQHSYADSFKRLLVETLKKAKATKTIEILSLPQLADGESFLCTLDLPPNYEPGFLYFAGKDAKICAQYHDIYAKQMVPIDKDIDSGVPFLAAAAKTRRKDLTEKFLDKIELSKNTGNLAVKMGPFSKIRSELLKPPAEALEEDLVKFMLDAKASIAKRNPTMQRANSRSPQKNSSPKNTQTGGIFAGLNMKSSSMMGKPTK